MSQFTRWLRGLTKHDPAERQFRRVMDTLPHNGIMVDLGANVGNITELALAYGHKVYAFEPDPFAFAKLRKRFGKNPNVILIPQAVGATNRRAKFFRSASVEIGGASQGSSLFPQDHRGQPIEVEVISITEFLTALPIPPVVIKIDIEGAEAEVLEALLDSGVYRSIGAILVETHDQISTEIAERLSLIRARIKEDRIANIDLSWL